jgi:hypothetical protein
VSSDRAAWGAAVAVAVVAGATMVASDLHDSVFYCSSRFIVFDFFSLWCFHSSCRDGRVPARFRRDARELFTFIVFQHIHAASWH